MDKQQKSKKRTELLNSTKRPKVGDDSVHMRPLYGLRFANLHALEPHSGGFQRGTHRICRRRQITVEVVASSRYETPVALSFIVPESTADVLRAVRDVIVVVVVAGRESISLHRSQHI